MSKPYLLFCLIPAFIVSGVALSYGIYDSTHPLQVFESDSIYCNDINTDLDKTKSKIVFTSCNNYSISKIEFVMSRDKDFIKEHCYEYDNKGKCSKAVSGMTLKEVRAKLDSKTVF